MGSGKRDKLFDNLISKEEISRELGISVKTVSNWMSKGKLPSIKIGRKNYAIRSSLEIWFEEIRKKGYIK